VSVRVISLIAAALALVSCQQQGDAVSAGRLRIRQGLEVHQVPTAELGPNGGSGLLTLFYFQPEYFELRLLTAAGQGPARPADEWLEDFGLLAVINASMYLPNQRSTGFMVDHEHSNNPAVNPRFGGFLAFGSSDSTVGPWHFAGSDCEGFSLQELRERYPVVVQNYRLLDCVGEVFEWSDDRSYSSAAIGLDKRGWLVFAHSGTTCKPQEFARWLALPRFGITAAHFVEGGPEASLMLRHGAQEFRVTGSWPGVRGSGFRDVPNVLGVVPRGEKVR